MSTFKLTKQHTLYLILCSVFITNALLAEIIGTKIFSFEKTFGFDPVQWSWGDVRLDFNLTAGVLVWPIVFVTTDLINEYYGRKGVQWISILTAGLIVYVFFMIYGTTQLTPADFWVQLHQTKFNGSDVTINEAYAIVLTQSLGIMVGSVAAFLVGQLIDATLFAWIKRRTQEKYLWLRSTGSTLISQGIDSYLVLWIAFSLFGGSSSWSFSFVFAVGTMNYIYKIAVAIALTPFLYWAHGRIDHYLKKDSFER